MVNISRQSLESSFYHGSSVFRAREEAGRGRANSRELWVDVCRRGFRTLTLFNAKIAPFKPFLVQRQILVWAN